MSTTRSDARRPFRGAAHLRAAARAAACAAVTALYTALLVATVPFTLGSPRRRRRWRSVLMTRWARRVCRVLGARTTVAGAPPRAPFVLVSNHLSYVDVIVLAAQTPAVFVAKSEVARWPVFGPLSRAVNTVFIDRRRMRDIPRVQRLLRGLLEDGHGIVLFPEGTSTGGDRVLPFRAPLLEVAAQSGWPVHYAGLGYRTPATLPPASELVCWWGDMTFADHLYRLFRLPGFAATITFGAEPVVERDRKRLAARLRDAVAAAAGLPRGSMPIVNSITAQNVAVLLQGIAVLETLDRRRFEATDAGLASGSLGEQFRHLGDFYTAFLAGVRGGRVDYDRRARERAVELEPERAAARLRELIAALERLDEPSDRPLEVRCDADPAFARNAGWSTSTVGRELQFLLSHTVHHYALVAVLLRAQGDTPPPEFGLAPSTLRYRRGR